MYGRFAAIRALLLGVALSMLVAPASLAESERPTDLEPADLEVYEINLDAAAFPFEERAIDVHEENMELLHAGVFNEWTEQSLSRLAQLMPGRYAKDEVSSGFLGPIDSHPPPVDLDFELPVGHGYEVLHSLSNCATVST